MADDANKTEKATPYKLDEAKKKGQVSKSTEITSFLMFIAFSITFLVVAQNIWDGLVEASTELLKASGSINITSTSVSVLFFDLVSYVTQLLAPILAVLVVGAVMFNVLQTGFIFSSHPITPDWKKLNPVSGFKKIFAKKTIFDLIKALIKVGVVWFLWVLLGDYWLDNILDSYGMTLPAFTSHWFNLAVTLVILLTLVLLPMALIDLGITTWDFAKKMMMSTQDVKDEHKKREGDPLVKQKQKQIQKELLKKSSAMSNVKDADVIITNPEHIAVAVKFTPSEMLAPKVLAMGEDNNAAIIRKIARTHSLPIIRNVPLARRLYKNSVVDGYIPESCYTDVAAIFRTLLGMDNKTNRESHS